MFSLTVIRIVLVSGPIGLAFLFLIFVDLIDQKEENYEIESWLPYPVIKIR